MGGISRFVFEFFDDFLGRFGITLGLHFGSVLETLSVDARLDPMLYAVCKNAQQQLGSNILASNIVLAATS